MSCPSVCWHRLSALVLCIAFAAAASAAEAAPANLVRNGDFSQVAGEQPEHWRADGSAQEVAQVLRAARDEQGRPCAQLVCTRCDSRSPAGHAMLAQTGGVALARGKTYEFSCRARAENLRGGTVSVALSDTKTWTNTGLQHQLTLGREWKTFRRVFVATRDVGPTGRLQFWFNEPGTLWVADVQIIECAAQDAEFTDAVAPAGGRNLVPNGSFEVGAGGWSSMGTGTGWGNLAGLHATVETADQMPHGKRFLRIPLGGDRTPVLYFDYYEPVVRRELRPLAASLGWIPLEKGAAYTLSCDLRAGRDGVPAVLGLRAGDPAGARRDYQQAVTLAKEWKRYAFTFRPECRYGFVFVGPNLQRDERVDVDVDAVQLEKGDKATDFEPRAAVEFALEPSQPGGVFVAGEPAQLALRLCNHGRTPAHATVRFDVKDYADRLVAWPDAAADLPPGQTMERALPLPPEWQGYYRVRATLEAAGRTESAEVRLARVPRRTADDSVCGINHAFASAGLIHIASKAGVTWYRDWSLKWQHVEPARGEFRWDVADVQIDRVLREGVKVLPMLPPFPSADWSSEAPAGLPTTGYPGVRIRQAWGPKDPQDLAAYIEKAAGRYKDRIRIWEFLNEPIYTDYALPSDSTNRYGGRKYAPADYVALLEVAAGAMRRADPGCKVIGGIGTGARGLTRTAIEAGCLKHVDIFNLHMYPGARPPESFGPEMDDLLALMDRSGGRKPIWITEFSYYGADDLPRKPFIPSPHSWSEERLLESERQCADYTMRYFLVMLSRGVQKIFIHSGASGAPNQPNFECALFAADGAPRKLLPALAVLTDLLGPSPAQAGERLFGDAGRALAFEAGPRCVIAAWQPGGGVTVSVPQAAGARWLDAMGREAGATVTLSDSPAYLVGPAGKARELLQSLQTQVEGGR